MSLSLETDAVLLKKKHVESPVKLRIDQMIISVDCLAGNRIWMTTFQDTEILHDLITARAAEVLGINEFELEEGNRANLAVLSAKSVWEAIRSHEAPPYVVKNEHNITRKQRRRE